MVLLRSSVIVQYKPDGVTPPGSGLTAVGSGAPGFTIIPPVGFVANPGALPNATAQPLDFTFYNALSVHTQDAGFTYVDPVSGANVWKMDGPNGGTVGAAPWAVHTYSEGGPYISQQWATGKYTLAYLRAFQGHWMVDFERGVGPSNWRPMVSVFGFEPSGTESICFSTKVGEEAIMYMFSGGQIRRVNFLTGATVEGGTNFPKTVEGNGWLTIDADARYFSVTTKSVGNQGFRVWDSISDTIYTRLLTGADEARLDKGLLKCMVFGGAVSDQGVWDFVTDVFNPFNYSGSNGLVIHNPAMRGYTLATNFNNSPSGLDQLDLNTMIWTDFKIDLFTGPPGFNSDNHQSGAAVLQPGNPSGDDDQWSSITQFFESTTDTGTTKIREAVGLVRGDNTVKYACGMFTGRPTTGLGTDADNYWSQGHAALSPDLTLLVFSNNMNMGNAGSGSDLIAPFIVELPVL